jgi:hypothetical protein
VSPKLDGSTNTHDPTATLNDIPPQGHGEYADVDLARGMEHCRQAALKIGGTLNLAAEELPPKRISRWTDGTTHAQGIIAL